VADSVDVGLPVGERVAVGVGLETPDASGVWSGVFTGVGLGDVASVGVWLRVGV
jgi:hypothetical protein